jgi:hypothetical protein
MDPGDDVFPRLSFGDGEMTSIAKTVQAADRAGCSPERKAPGGWEGGVMGAGGVTHDFVKAYRQMSLFRP